MPLTDFASSKLKIVIHHLFIQPREAADILLLTKMATYVVQPDSQRFCLGEIETVETITIPSSFVGVQNSLMII